MKKYVAVLMGMVATGAFAGAGLADRADPGIYGQLDLSNFPNPQLIERSPFVAEGKTQKASGAPVYFHVPEGHEQRWRAHCKEYAACDTPILFVTEHWFRTVYLPALGKHDGREQRYLEHVRRNRDTERDAQRTRERD